MLGGDEGESGHSHSHSHGTPAPSATSSAVAPASKDGLRARGASGKSESAVVESEPAVKGPSKLSAYLNLFGDFVHNM